MSASVHPLRESRGFTLVEMLVAMAVLALIVVLVLQMVNSPADTTTGSRKRIDADAEARGVLDRMGRDFAGMLNRPDADVLFQKNPANDVIYFMSEAPGVGSSPSTISLVGYRITTNSALLPGRPVLERLGKALPWDSTNGPVFLTYSGANTTPETNSTIPGRWSGVIGSDTYDNGSSGTDYQLLSPSVFRFEYCFLNKDGSYSSTNASGASGGLTNVAAVVVALGVLDETSRKIVTNSSNAPSSLRDPATDTLITNASGLMAAIWKTNVESVSFPSSSGLPKPAASQIRIYQRTFYLNR